MRSRQRNQPIGPVEIIDKMLYLFAMKKVSIYELKQDLSSIISEAENGTEVLITRHNKAVARLMTSRNEHLHAGARFGRAELKPAVRGRTAGRYLQFLKGDRSADRE